MTRLDTPASPIMCDRISSSTKRLKEVRNAREEARPPAGKNSCRLERLRECSRFDEGHTPSMSCTKLKVSCGSRI